MTSAGEMVLNDSVKHGYDTDGLHYTWNDICVSTG